MRAAPAVRVTVQPPAAARAAVALLGGLAMASAAAWLAGHAANLPARGEWRALAGEIAVSPEALYREIARRRTPPTACDSR
jgi:hypothetical protein